MHPALIFDLDGTLVDSAPDLVEATNAVLTEAGRRPIDPATLRHMVGFGARRLIEQAFAATGDPVQAARLPELADVFLAHYGEHLADFSRPFPGVEETLAQLKAQGARLGILTNKPALLTGPLLDRLNLTRYFDAIWGAGRMSYTKPDPRIFHDIVADLAGPQAGPVQAVMIGDSITDLETARGAGVPVVLVSYGYTPVPARALGADAVLDDMRELPAALEGLGIEWWARQGLNL